MVWVNPEYQSVNHVNVSKRSGPPGCSFWWTLWRGWGNLGIWLSLGGTDPRLFPRKSMWIASRDVWVYRLFRGASWSYFLRRWSQKTWGCLPSPETVQLHLAGWHNFSQTSQQVQTPRSKHAVRGGEVLIWVYPEVLGVIYFPCASAYAHKLHIYRWD